MRTKLSVTNSSAAWRKPPQNSKSVAPKEESTDVSSLITETEAKRIETWIGEARQGATIEPAILTDVSPTANLNAKEAFGPVVSVNSHKTLDDAIATVNASDHGLQAGMSAREFEKTSAPPAKSTAAASTGMKFPLFVSNKMPCGGVKLSGTGRKGPRAPSKK